jgi:hypothetical protein
VKFENRTNNENIKRAIFVAHDMLQPDTDMYDSVFYKDDWKYDGIKQGSHVIYNLIDIKRPVAQVFTYKPFNPWTSAIAYFDGKAIHFNIRKLPFLTVEQITGTLLHEYAHYCGFTHGNNFKTKEKCLYSVPYFLSENVSRWL